ncbi:hypothetical protein EAG_10709 [Camponotus floridanus]|uniref:Uncharacterized protein n=1 Tax=Camponotus floridanus TaxID=104421 RepID=E2AEK1_CAMFO|nr:hypothetical protein EAG_10709 [Camponotus floridanus]
MYGGCQKNSGLACDEFKWTKALCAYFALLMLMVEKRSRLQAVQGSAEESKNSICRAAFLPYPSSALGAAKRGPNQSAIYIYEYFQERVRPEAGVLLRLVFGQASVFIETRLCQVREGTFDEASESQFSFAFYVVSEDGRRQISGERDGFLPTTAAAAAALRRGALKNAGPREGYLLVRWLECMLLVYKDRLSSEIKARGEENRREIGKDTIIREKEYQLCEKKEKKPLSREAAAHSRINIVGDRQASRGDRISHELMELSGERTRGWSESELSTSVHLYQVEHHPDRAELSHADFSHVLWKNVNRKARIGLEMPQQRHNVASCRPICLYQREDSATPFHTCTQTLTLENEAKSKRRNSNPPPTPTHN